ncbi:hypothetical protein [Rouxiella sp. Mn2063]|uniref:hypothetical protein n=1 Tax=Rouxiella sp. Mn2063 TaxID=3395262 RepID=UPI003BC33135
MKYQKSAGFLRVACYPYGGLGCNAKLNTAFEKPKNSPFWFYKAASSSAKLEQIEKFTVPGFTKLPQARPSLSKSKNSPFPVLQSRPKLGQA